MLQISSISKLHDLIIFAKLCHKELIDAPLAYLGRMTSGVSLEMKSFRFFESAHGLKQIPLLDEGILGVIVFNFKCGIPQGSHVWPCSRTEQFWLHHCFDDESTVSFTDYTKKTF